MTGAGFEGIIGRGRQIRLLKAMIAADRLPHALLFTGPAQVGRRTLALALAQAVNCLAGENEAPCGVCQACRKIARGSHPDVAEIGPEGRLKLIKIDAVRELRKQIGYRPYEGRVKVHIVREAERMQAQGDYAANALLKTLEEPPPQSLLILTARQESDLLPTIVSRCLRLNLAPLPRTMVLDYLADQQGLTGPKAKLVAAMSEGCLGRALALSPDEVWDRRAEVADVLDELAGNDAPMLAWAEEVAEDPDRWPIVFSLLRFWYRDLMVLAGNGRVDHLINEDLADRLAPLAEDRDPETFASALETIDRAEYALDRLIRPQLVFENLLLGLAEIVES